MTELLPAAIEAGFELHHTEPDRVVLAAWLKPSASPLPGYTTHTVGVGAVVINSQRQILAIQEATGPASRAHGNAGAFWKYPTGLVDAGEGVAEAAVREVREETGVQAEVVSMIAMREAHLGSGGGGGAAGSSTNMFAVFLLRPLTEEIVIDGIEVAAAKWMDADEYVEQAAARMPPGGVYYTINELAVAAFDGRHTAGAWAGRELELGPKVSSAVGRGPNAANMVYFGVPPGQWDYRD